MLLFLFPSLFAFLFPNDLALWRTEQIIILIVSSPSSISIICIIKDFKRQSTNKQLITSDACLRPTHHHEYGLLRVNLRHSLGFHLRYVSASYITTSNKKLKKWNSSAFEVLFLSLMMAMMMMMMMMVTMRVLPFIQNNSRFLGVLCSWFMGSILGGM